MYFSYLIMYFFYLKMYFSYLIMYFFYLYKDTKDSLKVKNANGIFYIKRIFCNFIKIEKVHYKI